MTTLEKAAARYARAEEGREAARDALAAAVRAAVAAGMTESEAARLAGVTRMTVRAWLGKIDAYLSEQASA